MNDMELTKRLILNLLLILIQFFPDEYFEVSAPGLNIKYEFYINVIKNVNFLVLPQDVLNWPIVTDHKVLKTHTISKN